VIVASPLTDYFIEYAQGEGERMNFSKCEYGGVDLKLGNGSSVKASSIRSTYPGEGVKLTSGLEFAMMLIDAGLEDINDAFCP